MVILNGTDCGKVNALQLFARTEFSFGHLPMSSATRATHLLDFGVCLPSRETRKIQKILLCDEIQRFSSVMKVNHE